MTVLALDLASRAGWAAHSSGWAAPVFGEIDCRSPASEYGIAAELLRLKLAELHSEHGPFKFIVVEALPQPLHGNVASRDKIFALHVMADWFAHRTGATCRTLGIGQWRKIFLGAAPTSYSAKTGKRVGGWRTDSAKPAAIKRCLEYGWDVGSDHNAAEALGILNAFLDMLPGHVLPWRDRLLMGGCGANIR